MYDLVMKSKIDKEFIENKIKTYKHLNFQFALGKATGETWQDAYELLLGDFIKLSEELIKEKSRSVYCDCDDRSIASMIMCKDY